MKRILLLSLMCLITFSAFGQGKLIESSEDKRPVWIKRNVDRYDLLKIDQQSTVSLQDARDKAFEELHNLASNAITAYLMRTHVEGADVEKVRNDVENSQFIRNISEATSIQTYWEHRLAKKQDVYYYYILYDFNDTEKKKVALEINKDNFQNRLDEKF